MTLILTYCLTLILFRGIVWIFLFIGTPFINFDYFILLTSLTDILLRLYKLLRYDILFRLDKDVGYADDLYKGILLLFIILGLVIF